MTNQPAPRTERTRVYPHLGTPGRIAGLVTRNRIVKSPQATSTANPDGTVTERTVNHYRRLGRVGLVMVECIETHLVGSAASHGRVYAATHSAYFTARTV